MTGVTTAGCDGSRHSFIPVAVSPESPVHLAGTKDPPIGGGGVPGAHEWYPGSPMPCCGESPVPISGTTDHPSLMDDSPMVPMVNRPGRGGSNLMEGGSATL